MTTGNQRSAAWRKAVKTAQLAVLKSFEGRMKAAEASLVPVPENGRGAEGSLAEFAEDAGIEYVTLKHYRQIWKWLGRDWVHVDPIGSYSLAKEAALSGKWKTAKSFVSMIEKDPSPTLQLGGFEPHTFPRWTVDALRVYLGKQPTNTGLVALREASGEKVSGDEVRAAEAKDRFREGGEISVQIVDRQQSGAAAEAANEARRQAAEHHGENVSRDLRVYPPEPGEPTFGSLLESLGADNLPSEVAEAAAKLRRVLSVCPEWREKYGDKRWAPDSETFGELLDGTLAEEQDRTAMAFEGAAGRLSDKALSELLNSE